ncbi:hypothetical protein EJB05_31322, partial [Eragrostis curvula]
MKILESPLLGEFIAYLKANWTDGSRVDQRRRRLRQLILKVRAVTEVAEGHAVRAGSLAAWLTMLRDEALRGQKVDRLTEAVEELEHLAGPGGDLDQFMRLLRLDNDVRARGPAAMEVDGGRPVGDAQPQQQRQQEEIGSGGGGSVVPAGAKRKRACGSGVVKEGGGGSTSDGQVLHSVGARRKRRVLGWAWPRNWLPTFGGFFSARRPPPPAASRSHRARTVAVAMGRVRRRIGKPTGRRRPRPRQESIDQQLWRLSL